MSREKAIHPKSTSPDDLTKTTNRGSVELSEEQLNQATGGATGGNENPTESVSLNFNKIEWKYNQQK
jgi:type VI protein secretion system component Hcp